MDKALSLGRTPARIAYGALALVLLAAAIVTYGRGAAGWWVFPVFGLGPDLAFLLGLGETAHLVRGQMPRRAVPAYNALHRIWGPLALGALAAAHLVPPVFLVGALVWGVHVCFDRAVGYGLRTRDGFQRS